MGKLIKQIANDNMWTGSLDEKLHLHLQISEKRDEEMINSVSKKHLPLEY